MLTTLAEGGERGTVPAPARPAMRSNAGTSNFDLRQDADRPLRRRQNAGDEFPGHHAVPTSQNFLSSSRRISYSVCHCKVLIKLT